MADRIVLCIEPDAATVAEIRRTLSPHGLRIESISNGEQALEWARANSPVLIVLSVEPRKVGYAICNKIKRNPALKDVPLILVSAEETMATFEQHKKLKSRADDYLLKPFDNDTLLERVQRLVDLGGADAEAAELDEIELADDELAEVSDDDVSLVEEHTNTDIASLPDEVDEASYSNGAASAEAAPVADESLAMLGDLSRPSGGDPNAPSPFHDAASGPAEQVQFDVAQFDKETQDAFAALEAGSTDDGTPAPDVAQGSGALTPPATTESGGMVDLQSMWSDADLPAKMPWETGGAPSEPTHGDPLSAAPAGVVIGGSGSVAAAVEESGPFASSPTTASTAFEVVEDQLLAGLGTDVPPMPEEVLYDERAGARDAAADAAKDQQLAELQAELSALQGQVAAINGEKRAAEGRVSELQARIGSLETERQTLRKELDEQREHLTQTVNQGAFSKERDLLNLREIINRKEKDILDLRDGLDAKDRLILDHKDKIRELDRARRDLDERTLGFEKNLVAANEKVQELIQDKEKSVEREKGLKARLDDAHEELRKGQDEIEATRKRAAQDIERVRAEGEKVRFELEAKIADIEEARRAGLAKAADEYAAAEAAEKSAHQAEVQHLESEHRAEVEALQKRLTEELAAAAERLQNEVGKLRREHEKSVQSLKEEQALQLASERQAYETQTEAKHRTHREEILGLRRRHEEELAAAEERRQRDILEQEQRRVAELEQAETRRRVELQARDEEHHARVTESERRHLIEKTELADRHRTEHDQAVGRAVRSEGELAARVQELDQAYRRLAGFEADLNASRAELSDREVKLSQARDRINELEAKVSDYEDQVVRAFQRLRSDEKTTEKVRRALGVALALLDERTAPPQSGLKPTPAGDEAEKS
ncbi:MAG TPA: response regulator [Polyangia bacterium]|nr:response regulator [Polyangia bacterium]